VPPDYPPLRSLLASYGLERAPEEPFAHNGFSGATLSRLRRDDGASFVLKRLSIERDWIMRATDDGACREAALARAAPVLRPGVRSASLGAARDAEGFALLMRDIEPWLLPSGHVADADVDRVIAAMVALHATPPPDGVAWCDLRRRIMLVTPGGAEVAAAHGAPVAAAIREGWALFGRHGTARAVEIVHSLFADPAPLLKLLASLPPAFLHGDLWFENIGIDSAGEVWLFDWSMTLVAPPAVELARLIGVTEGRATLSHDEIMGRYAAAATITDPSQRALHDAATVLCGVLLRGFRKAIDAEAGQPGELRWWCERAEQAARYL